MKEKIAYEPGALDAVRYEKTVRIQTHENVSLEYEIAGIGSRYIAGWIDSLIRGAAYVTAIIVAMFFIDLNYTFEEALEKLFEEFENYYYLFLACYLALYLIRILYHLITELASGGSGPAKKMMGIRVVQVTGEAPTATQLLIRNLMRLIDVVPGGSIIDGLVALFNPQGRRCGDLAAGTMVIKYRKDKNIEEFLSAAVAYNPEDAAVSVGGPDIENLMSDAEGTEAGLAAENDFRREMFAALARDRGEAQSRGQEPENSGKADEYAFTAENGGDAAVDGTSASVMSDGFLGGFIPEEKKTVPQYELNQFMTEEETLMLRRYMLNRHKYVNRFMYDRRFARLISLRRGLEKTSGFSDKEAMDIMRQALVYLERCYPDLQFEVIT